MKRLIKVLVFATFVVALLSAGSFFAVRASVGKFLGSKPPVSGRQQTFAFKGVEGLAGTPRAWVFRYTSNRLGLRSVEIYVSPTGTILGTRPSNLAARLDQYEQREP
ncbi:MAG TPA: hypothetical protein VGA37_07765 [Gemmatimonadales bacterium]